MSTPTYTLSTPAADLLTNASAVAATLAAKTTVPEVRKYLEALPSVGWRPLLVGVCGDSIVQQGSNTVTAAVTNPYVADYSCGFASWLPVLSGQRIDLAVNRSPFDNNGVRRNHGYQGWKLPGLINGASGIYPSDECIRSRPDVFLLEGGINDVVIDSTPAVTVVERIATYWAKFTATGKPVFALDLLPVGAGAYAGFKDVVLAVNAALPALAADLGVTLVTTHDEATMSNGTATDESLYDSSLHPTPAYAHRIGAKVYAAMASLAAACPMRATIPNRGSALWLTGDNSPSQATKPTAWALNAGWAATYSAVTDADGTTWQRIRMLKDVANYGAMTLYIRASSGFVTPGDRLRFAARVRAKADSTFDVREFTAYGSYYDTGMRYISAMAGGSNLGAGLYDPVGGVFLSAPFTLPTGVSSVDAGLTVYGNALTLDIAQFGVFRHVD